MRKITLSSIMVFLVLSSLSLGLGIYTAKRLFEWVSVGDFYSVALTVTAIIFIYSYAILAYRGFLHFLPLREGEIGEGSQQEFVYQIHLLFHLIFFYPIIRNGFIPVPLMRMFYIALGARLGKNTYSSGIIYDSLFIHIGANCIIGEGSLLTPHAIEARKLAHYPIKIGNAVTIGAHAVVLGDVTIEDAAIVAAGAVIQKGTRINKGEIWGGVPAHRLGGGDSRNGIPAQNIDPVSF